MDNVKKVIVTHQNPDLDAIGAVWLLKRFDKQIYEQAEVTFVPAGNKISNQQLGDLEASMEEVTHVDTGDTDFDHHDESRTKDSASSLVLDYLKKKYKDLTDNPALSRIVSFINKTDQFESYFWPEPTNDRYIFNLEQILNGFKLGGHGDDHETVRLGIECLDGAYSMMKIIVEAEAEVKKGVEFESRWGSALGLLSSNDSTIKLAQKMGYNVVVRKDPEVGNVRIKAAPLPDIDLTSVYQKIIKLDQVGTWYFHPGKHMLINGSRKHQGQTPSPLTLEKTIEIIKSIK
jgi:hypothetical protein